MISPDRFNCFGKKKKKKVNGDAPYFRHGLLDRIYFGNCGTNKS